MAECSPDYPCEDESLGFRKAREQVGDVEKSKEILLDGVHVTDKGSGFYAQHIFATLLTVIQDLFSLDTHKLAITAESR